MIRFKYGLPEVTISSLSLYTAAITEANLLPPPEPKDSWCHIMDELSDISCKLYRGYVRENKDFVPYFRSATPEQELGKLPLGSRPAKRRPTGGVESLRAIPWIFARTQNRLMLPARLGAGTALQKWLKTVNRANLKRCAATGHSSPRALACWKWCSRKRTCGWQNTTISVWSKRAVAVR